MSTRKNITDEYGIFFITFTCYNWMNLISMYNAYDLVYKQFEKLKEDGHYIIGYVIMPNHIHFLIGYKNCGLLINSRIGTLKRFLAYDIIKAIKDKQDAEMLNILSEGVNKADKKRGKLHQVFESSLDIKICYNEKIILQKLNYMHLNPTKGTKPLVQNPSDYLHSSAKYYIEDLEGIYAITNYEMMNDIDLSIV